MLRHDYGYQQSFGIYPTSQQAELAVDQLVPPEVLKGGMSVLNEHWGCPSIMTVGHSTRTIEVFKEMLRAHGVKQVVDVRTIPRSRHNPQFNRDMLPETLSPAGIAYAHLNELGGLRRARPDSPNTGWRNTSFRGFADYMQTPEFASGLQALLQIAGLKQTAIMCAEAVPWRCHRSLIADALTVLGLPVVHIMSASKTQLHKLTPFASVEGQNITYPSVTYPSVDELGPTATP